MKGIQGANLIAIHFHKLAGVANDIAATLEKNESLHTQLPVRAARVRNIICLVQSAIADVKLQDWHVLRSDQPGAAAARTHLRSEQHACREALKTCMDACLLHLQCLDTSIIDIRNHHPTDSSRHPTNLGVFVRLWEFMTDTWRWSNIVVFAGMSQMLGDVVTVGPECMDILSWLLRLLRSRSAGLHALKAVEADEAVWLQGAICLLQPLISFLLHNRTLPAKALTRALAALPDGFLTTACCIACELSPTHLSRAQLPSSGLLSELVTDIVQGLDSILLQCYHSQELHPELITTATVEAFKLGVFYSSTLPPTETTDLVGTYNTFSYVLSLLRGGEEYAVRHKIAVQESAAKGGGSSSSSKAVDDGGIYPRDNIPNHLVPRCSISDLELMSVVCDQLSKIGSDDVRPKFAKSVGELIHVVARQMPGSILGDREAACMKDLALHSSFGVRRGMQQQLQQQQRTQLYQWHGQHLGRVQQRLDQLQREEALSHCQQEKRMLLQEVELISQQLDVQAQEVHSMQDDEQRHHRVARQPCVSMEHLQHLLLWLTEACTHSLNADREGVFQTFQQRQWELAQQAADSQKTSQQQQEQQQQLEQRSFCAVPPTLAWRKLHAWRSMAGCTAVTEAVLRVGQHSHTPHLIVSATRSFSANLALQIKDVSFLPWQFHISLASTLFKLVSMPSIKDGAEVGLMHHSPVMYLAVIRALRAAATSVRGFILQGSTASCLTARQPEQTTGVGNSVGGDTQPFTSCGVAGNTPDDQHSMGATSCAGPKQEESISSPHLELEHGNAHLQGAKRLCAILELTRIRVTIRTLLTRDRSSKADMDMRQVLLELAQPSTQQDADLADLGSLLSQLSDAKELGCDGGYVKRREAGVWGRYALKHFQGRLLAGCGNLSRHNLGGVSEAALPTLLCSGCRRIRYCSVECQRAAWVEGSHRELCGTHMSETLACVTR